MSKVFLLPVHVTPTKNTSVPMASGGACVNCYCATEDVKTAVDNAIAKLEADGMIVEKILEPIEQMDSSQWTLHINERWSELAFSLMVQEEFEAAIADDQVVFGPFDVYSPSY